ncbi:IS5 family transposase [Caldovatus aquaticus]|uniref:IS5 family transposase n=1 Tax=Caldovatus aquaticus TaxID=2865671 RepID=A0ABS7F7C5_9PROT|nr:IS5 family transposase [Caldovatus aquaticus]MBW8271526.1 IS5 family transposase [Caldovatus aquaticus]
MRRRRRPYPTDLTDAQWAAIAELVPQARPGGRPRRASSRELVNAILYVLRGGMAWRLLPHDFPPWQTVYYYLRRWQAEGVWERIHHAVLLADRARAGREASPTAAIIDSQSVRTGDKGGSRGYDAGKKIAGRKRHILTDTDGRLLAVQVHAGSLQDRDGAKPLLRASRGLWCFVQTVFADGGYAGKLVAWAKQKANLALSIVRRPRALSRFAPLPRRWVIERSFGWLIKHRRLVRDFEQRTDVAETLIVIAATATMLRRIT